MESLLTQMPIIKARDRLTSLPEDLATDPGVIAITRRGEPVLAILPWELYEAIVETLEILSDDELIAALRGFNSGFCSESTHSAPMPA